MNDKGFTLIELLIAMSLTSIIGMVLFSTYDMVMQFGKESKAVVFKKEQERIFVSILDNDFANIAIVHNEPIPIFLSPQKLSETFKQFSGTEETDSADILLISIQTTFSVFEQNSETMLPSANTVEYYLRKTKQGYSLVRKENPFAGIDVIAQKSELLLDKNIKEVSIEALYNEQYYSNWTEQIKNDENFYPQAFKFVFLYNNQKEFSFIIPIPARERAMQ